LIDRAVLRTFLMLVAVTIPLAIAIPSTGGGDAALEAERNGPSNARDHDGARRQRHANKSIPRRE
jgi:hypothetical protein